MVFKNEEGNYLIFMNKTITKAIVAATAALGITVAGKSVSADEVVTAQAGDSVWSIAQDKNTTIGAIEAINPDIDKNTHVIFVGQEIKVNADVTGDEVVNHDQIKQVVVQPQAPVQQPAQQAPAKVEQPAQPVQKPAQQAQTTRDISAPAVDNNSAKAWIASKESGGSYTAQNGQYYGKYQLSLDKLHGDLSPANQEKVANEYAQSRYGGWDAAQSAWESQNWW